MDLLVSFDHYLTLPREQAYNQFLDEKNLRIFKVILMISIIGYVIIFIVNLADNQSLNLSLMLTFVNLLILSVARIKYSSFFNVSNIRKYIFIFIVVQLFVSIAADLFYPSDKDGSKSTIEKSHNEAVKKDSVNTGDIKISLGNEKEETFVQYIFFVCLLIVIFKLSKTEIIQIFSIGLGVPLILMIIVNAKFAPDTTIPNTAFGVMFFIIALTSERKRQKKFYEQYDFNHNKNFENIRMRKELNYAREIQLSMLPKNEAVIGDLEIAAISIPATEVGGDYFDYFKVSETEVGIFICDVSGHGVASGLLLSGLRSCMHLILEDNTNPKIVIEKLNRMIRKTQNRKMFVTAIFAIIDLEKNKCMLYNAGHLPPYKISGESKEIFKIRKHGLALGAMNIIEAAGTDNDVVIDFNKNDKIVFYTDGANEAMNEKKAEYGLENLESYLNNNADQKANLLLNGIIADIKKFTGKSNQRDDLTFLIVQRN
ncbi:MAG: PP2C family protein-serine/threonine phosphatase [Ignavibacteria bacterium]